ncbi:MAG: helix-turn-helix domain-containing protein [Ktedonobacteraceae bacterium]
MARRKNPTVVQPLLLSVSDVAIQLGVCRNTVYKLMRCNNLPTVMLCGVRRVHPSSLQDWLKQHEQQSA